jgi:hypothetical protein
MILTSAEETLRLFQNLQPDETLLLSFNSKKETKDYRKELQKELVKNSSNIDVVIRASGNTIKLKKVSNYSKRTFDKNGVEVIINTEEGGQR